MTYHVTNWLPGRLHDGGSREPPGPCPNLLTDEEAARYLRLDTTKTTDPVRSLNRLRETNDIPAVCLGKRLFYRRVDLDHFLEQRLREQPR